MDINKLLAGVKCSCGKVHLCDIKTVCVEDGAIGRLGEFFKDYSRILLVADGNTYLAAGEACCSVLGESVFHKIIFDGSRVLIPNEDSIERVEAELGDADLILGVGSGVIQDLCKYVSKDKGVPYAVVATAPSMDGYASNGAAMITGGMKVTYPAGLPIAIIADTSVIANAPMEMIKAGFGDIIGKYSALCDWKLSALVNGEYFCDYIYDTTNDMIVETLGAVKGILARDKNSLRILTEALIVVGIMMSFAGSSRPASGSEHHLSHFFEIVGIVKNEDYFPHGIDVIYSTYVTAKLREKLLNTKFKKTSTRQSEDELKSELERVYASCAEGCMALQEKVGSYKRELADIYVKNERKIKKVLGEMPPAAMIREILQLGEIDIAPLFEMYGREKICDAVRYAKDLKDRYTVLWLAYDMDVTLSPEEL